MISKITFTKWLVVFALLISVQISSVKAQQVTLSTEVERNVAGMNYGGAIAFANKRHFSVGGFYQFAIQGTGAELRQSRKCYGLQLQLPLVSRGRISLGLNARSGLINKNFLVFIPALVTTLTLSSQFSLSIGTAVRMQNPALTGKVNITL
jgi:hypothetical protein